jgi:mRNA-degrading endonuclease toxin of MazEF toxin-antitoxin module
VVLDQIRTVDSQRLVRRLGKLPAGAHSRILEVLAEMFAA